MIYQEFTIEGEPMFLLFAFSVALSKGSTGWIAFWIFLHWITHSCSYACKREHK